MHTFQVRAGASGVRGHLLWRDLYVRARIVSTVPCTSSIAALCCATRMSVRLLLRRGWRRAPAPPASAERLVAGGPWTYTWFEFFLYRHAQRCTRRATVLGAREPCVRPTHAPVNSPGGSASMVKREQWGTLRLPTEVGNKRGTPGGTAAQSIILDLLLVGRVENPPLKMSVPGKSSER